MKLAISLTFLVASPATVLSQVGGPAVGPYLASLDVVETASTTTVIGKHDQEFLVYDVDASGDLSLLQAVEAGEFLFSSAGPDRFAARHRDGALPQLRVYELGASGWDLAYVLEAPPIHGSVQFGRATAFVGSTMLVSDPGASEIDVYDVSVAGTATLTQEIALPAGKWTVELEASGDDLVARVDDIALVTGGVEVHHFRRGATGWQLHEVLMPPAGIDWSTSRLSLAVDDARLAIGAPHGTTNSPCGCVWIYEQSGASFVLDDEIADPGVCSISPTASAGFGLIEALRGDDLLIRKLSTDVAYRYEHVAGQWQRRERHLTDGLQYSSFALAREWVVGRSELGRQVFDTVDSEADIVVVCPGGLGVAGNLEWELSILRRDSVSDLSMRLNAGDFPWSSSDLAYLVVARERGASVLGSGGTLCVSDRSRRLLANVTSVLPSVHFAYVEVDFGALGFVGGDTAFVQMWRHTPAIPGGVTSNALAITFAP